MAWIGDIWVLTMGSLLLGSANCQLAKDLEPPGRWVGGIYVRNLIDCAEVGRPDHNGWSYSLAGMLSSVNREKEVKRCTCSLLSAFWLCVQCGLLFQIVPPGLLCQKTITLDYEVEKNSPPPPCLICLCDIHPQQQERKLSHICTETS